MPVVDATLVAGMRAAAEDVMLADSAQILRNSEQSAASDALGGGGSLSDWSVIATVNCRVGWRRPKTEEDVAGQVKARTAYEARFAYGTDIKPSDRVQVTTGSYPGLYYVTDVMSGQTDAVLLTVWIEALEQ